MFARDVDRWLKSNSTNDYRRFLQDTRADTDALLRGLSIPSSSQLAYFYLNHGPGTCQGWYTLIEPDEIDEATKYVREELGVPAGYIALTGFEGEGVVLYALESERVFDLTLSNLAAFQAGTLKPLADTFEGFLRWCMQHSDAG